MSKYATPSSRKSVKSEMNRCDESIIGTAYDATYSKLSTASAGYYEDPFLQHNMVKAKGSSQRISAQQQPIIRRGTHARVCVMDYAIDNFLHICSSSLDAKEVQIVMIGAGLNMDFWRAQNGMLMTNDCKSSIHKKPSCYRFSDTRFYEIDHPSLMRKKLNLLEANPLVDFNNEKVISGKRPCQDGNSKTLHDVEIVSYAIEPRPVTSSSLESPNPHAICHLIGYDLRNSYKNLLEILVDKHAFKKEAPTLFLSECVQMYLPDVQSRHLLEDIASSCDYSFLAMYDPILLHDRFGNTMEQNIKKKGLIADSTMSILQNRTLKRQVDKLYECGFDVITGCDMMDAYNTVVSIAHKQQANRCEILDEVEEWNLIMRHYCFVVACSFRDMNKSDSSLTHQAVSKFCSCGVDGLFGFDPLKSITRRQPPNETQECYSKSMGVSHS